jgi:hypothetical protein
LEKKKIEEAKKKLDAELFKTAQVAQKIPFGTGEFGSKCPAGNGCADVQIRRRFVEWALESGDADDRCCANTSKRDTARKVRSLIRVRGES